MENYIPNINLYGLWQGISSWFSYRKKNYSQEDMIKTIEKLKNIQHNIIERIDTIDKNIIIFFTKSKKFYVEKNKKSAIYNLKLKKMYEREKEKLDSINFNIESQIFSIESMGLIIETAETLKDTSIHMKSINSNLDIDKIESTMEELQENRDIGEELQSIFSESINMVFDEDDLLNELKELDNNEEEENIDVNVPKTSIKPTIKITENNNNIQLPISHNKPIIVENALINKSENKVENTPAPLLAS
jgi:hypothetical protein